MKKLSIALVVAALLALTSGIASADTWNGVDYDFVDMIDTWTILGIPGWDAMPIVEGTPLTYTHTISGYLIPDEYLVTEAWLNLDFTNDSTDKVTILWDNREYVEVGYDGTEWHDLGEVGDGQYVLIVGIDWLNDDGKLDVTINVTNPGWNPATAYLDHSVLYGNVSVVPVPGAVLLGVLGLSAAGIKLRKNRAA